MGPIFAKVAWGGKRQVERAREIKERTNNLALEVLN